MRIEKKKKQKKGLGNGLKRTPQRLAILDYLDGNTAHPSAEEVYKAVSKKYQSMSFATVYNTLHALTSTGLLRELSVDPDRKRYDPNISPHHHFICVTCRKIVDVMDDIRIALPKAIARECSIVESHVEFYGYCAACKKKQKM